MNPVERVIRPIDAFQQRHTPTAFAFGLIKKFGDDNGSVLVGNLAYAAFVAVFPLLLILVTVLVQVASSDPAVLHAVLHAAESQFPAVGQKLGQNIHALNRSSVAGLVVGMLVLVWGVSGLAQAGLFTMAQVWTLPGPARPGYVPRLGRAAIFLGILGVGVVVTTALASLGTFGKHIPALVALAEVLAVLTNIAMYFAGFRVLTPKGIAHRDLVPGAISGGIAWTVLQAIGAYLVHHYLRSDSIYGVFATVLGLLAWIYICVEVTVYAAEINVVLKRRLWPRSIVQPPLTEADRKSIALQALMNQRRAEQHVKVSFIDREPGDHAHGGTPTTAAEMSPPGPPPAVSPPAAAAVPGGEHAGDDTD